MYSMHVVAGIFYFLFVAQDILSTMVSRADSDQN